MTQQERIELAAQRSDAGYGLVAVIVAMILLSVGVLSVSSVLTQSVAMQTISSQRANALFIAQTEMEKIRAMDPLTVAAVAEVAVDENGTPNINGVFTREVTVGVAGRRLIEVTVIVTGPRMNPIRLQTWIYDGDF